MKPQREAFGLPNHETHVERQLSSINYKFRILVWIHVVGFVSGLITTICVSVIASRYWGQARAPAALARPSALSPASARSRRDHRGGRPGAGAGHVQRRVQPDAAGG